jgi:exocyst complex component 2
MQVEKIMGDMKATLGRRLRDPKRPLEEVEKTIEYGLFFAACYLGTNFESRIYLELDPSHDPISVFLDTQHKHLLNLLKSAHSAAIAKFEGIFHCL